MWFFIQLICIGGLLTQTGGQFLGVFIALLFLMLLGAK